MRGTFEELSQQEVIQLLVMNRKTGWLRVNNTHRQIDIYLRDGVIIHAEGEYFQGEEAFYEPFSWIAGKFEFVSESVEGEPTLTVGWQQLLFEATRRAGELAEMSKRVGSFCAVPSLVDNPNAVDYSADSEAGQLLSMINGSSNAITLAEELHLTLYRVLKILDELRYNQLISINVEPVANRLRGILEASLEDKAEAFITREVRRLGHHLEVATPDDLREMSKRLEQFAVNYVPRTKARALAVGLRTYAQELEDG